jgi:predicted nucleic acid-binding Zn ribbon protein
MERAARLIKNKKLSRELVNEEDIVRAVWPTAVGKKIADHTARLKLVRRNLVVEVEDATWQRQLHGLSRQIVDRIQKLTGSNAVEEIEFRIGVPRRQPQRAETRDAGLFTASALEDEAESIQDPVMRRLYRLSRKKATG